MVLTDQAIILTQPDNVMLLETGVDKDCLELISRFLQLNSQAKGIYVSANRSTKDLTEKLQKYQYDLDAKLKAEQVFVVDLVSKSVGEQEVKGAVYVSSPAELSATQLAIEGLITKTKPEPGKAWLILDSLPTLLIYNGAGALLNFLHFLIGRMRVLGFNCAIFTVEGALSPRVFSTVAQLCDKAIKI